MSIHVAILQRPYLDLVLSGRKTIESRLSKAAMAPFGRVSVGERIFIKASGGRFMATALAESVQSFENLMPSRVQALRRQFNAGVMGDDGYWRAKRNSRYATFVRLGAVEPLEVGPAYGKSAYRAWFVLDDEASPLLDVSLTAGAIGNGYVPVTGRGGFFGQERFELILPDGRRVETDIHAGRRLRWRGWRGYYETQGVSAGDAVRFVALGPGRYRVSFKKRAVDGSTACAKVRGGQA